MVPRGQRDGSLRPYSRFSWKNFPNRNPVCLHRLSTLAIFLIPCNPSWNEVSRNYDVPLCVISATDHVLCSLFVRSNYLILSQILSCSITIKILNIIHRPVFYLNLIVSEIGFYLRIQVVPTQLGSIRRQGLSLSIGPN
jgi:hypothetical protein